MKRLLLTIVLLVSTASSLACTTPLLNEWVNDRGYQFHQDYSSIDTLGWVAQEPGVLIPSQMLQVVGRERGELPDIARSKNLVFKIEGKIETQKFIRQLVDVTATEEFEKVQSAEIQLIKPFKYEATKIVPLAVCNNQEITLVTKVLNTGEMTVKLFDEVKNNITGKLTIKGADVTGKSELRLKEENFLSRT